MGILILFLCFAIVTGCYISQLLGNHAAIPASAEAARLALAHLRDSTRWMSAFEILGLIAIGAALGRSDIAITSAMRLFGCATATFIAAALLCSTLVLCALPPLVLRLHTSEDEHAKSAANDVLEFRLSAAGLGIKLRFAVMLHVWFWIAAVLACVGFICFTNYFPR